MTRASAFLAALVMVGCSGAGTKPVAPPPHDPSPSPPAVPSTDPDGPGPGPIATPDPKVEHKPELFPPAWKQVGVGQTISFGVTAIDQDLDETRVEVTTMPASATFDAVTQTVTWTPTKAELGAGGTFVLKVSQADTAGGAWTRTEDVTFTIPVVKTRQPAPVAEPQAATVETLLTIRDRARLTAVNLDWPLDKLLVRGAELLRVTLPPEAQARLAAPERQAMYTSFLKALAQTHDNPRLDPDSPQFDRDAFGTPESWKIVAVRPRIDKKWTELRLVYQATAAPEPVFAMFRLRPTWDVPTLPPEARAVNNEIFLGLVAKHLLGKDLGPNPAFAKNAKAHARAVSAFVKAVIAYQPPTPKRGQAAAPPWQRAAFVALPTEARMGGGSARDAAGAYRSGDAWAWGVMKPMPTADGAAQAYVNMPIPGFWTKAVPAPDNKSWVPACAPKFNPDDPTHAAGQEVLCRKALGFVDLPEVKDGKLVSSKRDAVNLFVDHKRVDSVALLPLDDGRRDHGEENGMTCAQCHIRQFGVRDYTDPATADPSAGTPATPNAKLATVNFQIVPSATSPKWEAFTLVFMQDQECKGKANLEQFLGKPSALTCPLAPR